MYHWTFFSLIKHIYIYIYIYIYTYIYIYVYIFILLFKLVTHLFPFFSIVRSKRTEAK